MLRPSDHSCSLSIHCRIILCCFPRFQDNCMARARILRRSIQPAENLHDDHSSRYVVRCHPFEDLSRRHQKSLVSIQMPRNHTATQVLIRRPHNCIVGLSVSRAYPLRREPNSGILHVFYQKHCFIPYLSLNKYQVRRRW